MTQKPDSALASKLKEVEAHMKKCVLLLTATNKKYASLQVKFREKDRENQRLKLEIERLKRELKSAQSRAIWSDDEEMR